MKNTILCVVGVVAVLGIGFFALNSYIYNEKQGDQEPAMRHKDAAYVINGQIVQLVNGVSETEAAPGSASRIVTRYFGNEAKYDIDKDGREDVVFLLTQETGGSGVFYYAVAALNKESGYVGSQGFLLGDRIAPQTTEKGTGVIAIVNYADRAQGEDFSVRPSVGKTAWLFLDTNSMQFGEVDQGFTGEADPSRMTLGMKSWTWVKAIYNDGREVLPRQTLAFTIDFFDDGKFSATTDCNRVAGSYSVLNKKISFSKMISTKMACEGSEEAIFTGLLENSQEYQFTSKGELILGLKFDSGTVTFR